MEKTPKTATAPSPEHGAAPAPTEGTCTPQSLISEENVMKALQADKGKDAQLITWHVVDFTSKGDNYACVVTSVEVKFALNGKEKDVVYVVKLNPCRSFPGMESTTSAFFTKEAKFYAEILPELNEVLKAAGKERLRMPKYLHSCLKMGKEQIYFEDLRAKDFKMFDRKRGMDKYHTLLVLKELGRLHAASYLLQSRTPNKPLEEKYEFLLKDFLNMSENSRDIMLPMLKGHLKTSAGMLRKVGGYERAVKWIESTLEPKLEELLTTGLRSARFECVNHGDAWNNNILFRYNDDMPVDVRLLDLQICRKASLAVDLNYFLYTSLTGNVRAPNLDHFLSSYYTSYKQVLAAEGFDMHFTEPELRKEFVSRNEFGAVFAMLIIPLILIESEKAPDFTEFDGDMDKAMDTFSSIGRDMMDTNPLMKPRFLAIFDEMMENGTIP